MTKEIAVMGPSDFVLGFNLAGVRRTFATETKDFPRQMEKLLQQPENVGILIIQSSDMETLPPLLRRKAADSIDPVVISMGEGAGENDLREKVKRAIGIDIMNK